LSIEQAPVLLRRINVSDSEPEALRNDLLGDSPEQFLKNLGGATAIFLEGENTETTRVLCTLLHGNEPSGTRAVYDYLSSGQQPCTNAVFILASVQAATNEPFFSNRMLPGNRDLNRCFKPPFYDEQGQLAEHILGLINELQPECVIDMHNTSGSGPAFGVAIKEDNLHVALTSLFTNDLIVTDLRLGALMELSERDVPTVTIECGGANDHSSQIIAQEGLHRLLSAKTIFEDKGESYPVKIYHNPIRLETIGDAEVAYGESSESAAITLPAQAEKFNYGTLTKDECIGTLSKAGFSQLSAKDHLGNERLNDFFEERDGGLYPRHPLKVFMVTNNPFIARTDCLFYFIGE
jgi:Succinylglutamate desuccinylase / Aspartoacylase family